MKGFRVLCIALLLTLALPAVAMAQSTGTTSNAPGGSNQTVAPQANNSTNGSTSGGTPLPESTQQSSSGGETSDDSPDNATPIKIGEQVTGQLPVGDQDWTTFSVDSGGEISVSVTAQNHTNMSAFIYSDSELLESAYVPPGGQMSLSAPVDAGGQYFVFVRNEAPDTPGSYAFQVSESTSSTSETPTPGGNESGAEEGTSGVGIFRILGIVVVVILVLAASYTLYKRRGDEEEEAE